MERILEVRERVLKELERAREEKRLGHSLEARVALRAPESWRAPLEEHRADLPSLFIVSAVGLEFHSGPDLEVRVEKAPGGKCPRCWNYSPEVGRGDAPPQLCPRCRRVLERQGS